MKKSHWPIPEKKAKRGVEDILFWKTPWNFSFFYFTLQILHKTKPNPLDIPKLCQIPWNSKTENEDPPHKKISEILLLHSGIIVVLSNK